tara:strand:- start:1412 stop:1663 length:252 start_codon:yes stop_codon:yes gene_type:complete
MNTSPYQVASPMGTLELLKEKARTYANLGFTPSDKFSISPSISGGNPLIKIRFKPTKNQTIRARLQEDPSGGVMGGIDYRYRF